MQRKGKHYNGSRKNKKHKDAKVHKSDWLGVSFTQSEWDAGIRKGMLPAYEGDKIIFDSTQRNKPNHVSRAIEITDCFPLASYTH